jgi:glycosyltransferase involved in cell wall biosynthesis
MLKLQKKGFNLLTTIHHPITSDLEIALNANDDKWQRFFIRRWYAFLGMQKSVASQLDHVVTVSKQSTIDISNDFSIDEKNIHLIYNGIDTDVFKPMRGVKRDPWQLMAIASADQPLKGLRYLLLALSQLVSKYPQLNLLLVSKPQENGETEKLIKSLNLAKHIQFVHGISTDALVKHYAESSIAIAPSVYEGFGLPAGEAMACAVPLVSTNGGALPEVVGDAGVTVAIKDPTAMANAIEELLLNADARKRYGKLGRKRIEKNFSWALAAKEMTALYYNIIDNKQPNVELSSNKLPSDELFEKSDFSEEEAANAHH